MTTATTTDEQQNQEKEYEASAQQESPGLVLAYTLRILLYTNVVSSLLNSVICDPSQDYVRRLDYPYSQAVHVDTSYFKRGTDVYR